MSGETEAEVSAWTVDSLRVHFEMLLQERDARYAERFEASQVAIQAALIEREKAVKAAFEAQETAVQVALASIKTFYDTILAERDERYRQRFDGQERAITVALAAVDKEFHEHIRAVREETTVALVSADKAITKSETANEKRFESVNEFRAQQADMIQTFARKDEVDTRLIGLTEKFDAFHTHSVAQGNAMLPRAEYDRAHTDLVERVLQVERTFSEKLEQQAKSYESRIAGLQSQLSSIQAITG